MRRIYKHSFGSPADDRGNHKPLTSGWQGLRPSPRARPTPDRSGTRSRLEPLPEAWRHCQKLLALTSHASEPLLRINSRRATDGRCAHGWSAGRARGRASSSPPSAFVFTKMTAISSPEILVSILRSAAAVHPLALVSRSRETMRRCSKRCQPARFPFSCRRRSARNRNPRPDRVPRHEEAP